MPVWRRVKTFEFGSPLALYSKSSLGRDSCCSGRAASPYGAPLACTRSRSKRKDIVRRNGMQPASLLCRASGASPAACANCALSPCVLPFRKSVEDPEGEPDGEDVVCEKTGMWEAGDRWRPEKPERGPEELKLAVIVGANSAAIVIRDRILQPAFLQLTRRRGRKSSARTLEDSWSGSSQRCWDFCWFSMAPLCKLSTHSETPPLFWSSGPSFLVSKFVHRFRALG